MQAIDMMSGSGTDVEVQIISVYTAVAKQKELMMSSYRSYKCYHKPVQGPAAGMYEVMTACTSFHGLPKQQVFNSMKSLCLAHDQCPA
jgi:hypothetical protein